LCFTGIQAAIALRQYDGTFPGTLEHFSLATWRTGNGVGHISEIVGSG